MMAYFPKYPDEEMIVVYKSSRHSTAPAALSAFERFNTPRNLLHAGKEHITC